MRRRGWILWLSFITRRDLMTRADEGRLILVGLEMTVTTAPFRAWWRSDAAEIATRLAGGAL